MASLEGICEGCGNTGIAGDICSNCGNRMVPLDADLDRFEEGEESDSVISPTRKNRAMDDFEVGPDEEDLKVLDVDEDDLDDLDEIGDAGTRTASLEELAEDENERENRQGDLRQMNINEDSDEEIAA